MKFNCQALHRPTTSKECALAQKELPKHFCEGCDWFTTAITELAKPQKKVVTGRVPLKYTVYISKQLKIILVEKSKKLNLQPAEYIAKILAKTLLDIE